MWPMSPLSLQIRPPSLPSVICRCTRRLSTAQTSRPGRRCRDPGLAFDGICFSIPSCCSIDMAPKCSAASTHIVSGHCVAMSRKKSSMASENEYPRRCQLALVDLARTLQIPPDEFHLNHRVGGDEVGRDGGVVLGVRLQHHLHGLYTRASDCTMASSKKRPVGGLASTRTGSNSIKCFLTREADESPLDLEPDVRPRLADALHRPRDVEPDRVPAWCARA